jgi:5-methyltetrahydropteroyltriglutamate--homocysteine methyltransferase
LKEVTDWGITALDRAAEGLGRKTAVQMCYGYVIKANIDWKASLGAEWRQYDLRGKEAVSVRAEVFGL